MFFFVNLQLRKQWKKEHKYKPVKQQIDNKPVILLFITDIFEENFLFHITNNKKHNEF